MSREIHTAFLGKRDYVVEPPSLRPLSFSKYPARDDSKGEGNNLSKLFQELSTKTVRPGGLISPKFEEHSLDISSSDREPARHLISNMTEKMLKQLGRQFALGSPTLGESIGFRDRGTTPLTVLIFQGREEGRGRLSI